MSVPTANLLLSFLFFRKARKKGNIQSTIVFSMCLKLLKKFSEGVKIFCRLCSKDLKMGTQRTFHVQNAIDHAAGAHLKKRIYFCKYCSKSYTAFRSMWSHLRNSHGLSSADHYVDQSANVETELLNTIRACYDKNSRYRRAPKSETVRKCHERKSKKQGALNSEPSVARYVHMAVYCA